MDGEMDPSLWSSLPAALLESVLAKLPFLCLIRMRLVCKSWNSLIVSEDFSPPNPNPMSLLLHTVPIYEDIHQSGNNSADYKRAYRPSLVSYDTAKACWHKLFLNCPPEVLNQDNVWLPRLAATGGGLLCFDISSFTESNFIVCNPVTSKWRRLPCMGLHPPLSSATSGTAVRWRVAGLAYNESRRSYKLVVAGFCREDRDEGRNWFLKGTQVYDSVTESWELTLQDRDMMGGSCSCKYAFNKSLFWNDHLYVVTSMDLGCGHEVAIFSMKKGTWIEVSAFDFTMDVGPAYLVLHEEQILLVAEDSEEIYNQTLGFWKLNIPDMETMWSNIQPDTENLWLKLKCIERDQLPLNTGDQTKFLKWACIGHRNFASFLFCTKDFYRPFDTVLVHDLREDTWRQLPCTRSFEVEDFCGFEPSLSASV